MTKDVILLISGGLIALLSSLITVIVSSFLQERREKKKWDREDRIRQKKSFDREQKNIGDIVAKDQLIGLTGESEITRLKPYRWYCIASDMMITMADGTLKPIQDIKEGNILRTYNEKSRSFRSIKVEQIEKKEEKEFMVFNDSLRTSKSHSLYSTEGWVSAFNIRIGMYLVRVDNSAEQVYKIELIKQPIQVFGVVLKQEAGFFAEGYCVSDLSFKQSVIQNDINHGYGQPFENKEKGEIIPEE